MINNLRSLVRPILTISGWLVLCYLAITTDTVREIFLGAIATMIGFWFGTRSISK